MGRKTSFSGYFLTMQSKASFLSALSLFSIAQLLIPNAAGAISPFPLSLQERAGNLLQSTSEIHPSCSWPTEESVTEGTEILVDVVQKTFG